MAFAYDPDGASVCRERLLPCFALRFFQQPWVVFFFVRKRPLHFKWLINIDVYLYILYIVSWRDIHYIYIDNLYNCIKPGLKLIC